MASIKKRRNGDGSTSWDAMVRIVYPPTGKSFRSKMAAELWAARTQSRAKGGMLVSDGGMTLADLIYEGVPAETNRSVIVRLIALLLLVTPAAFAQSITIRGAGNDSCGAFIQNTTGDHAEQYKESYRQWVYGFVSGHNWANSKQQSRTVDEATVIAYLTNFCQRNPLMTVNAGTWALVAETGGKPIQFQYQK